MNVRLYWLLLKYPIEPIRVEVSVTTSPLQSETERERFPFTRLLNIFPIVRWDILFLDRSC
jgi:hypothetical protein